MTAEQITQGAKNRYSIKACNINALSSPNCDLDRPNQILFFGNSHEPDARNTFEHIYKDNPNINLVSFGTTNRCKIEIKGGTFFTDVTALNCKSRTEALNRHKHAFTHIVYGANLPFSGNKDFFWQALELMKNKNPNLHIIVMGGFLNTKEPCSVLINRHGSFEACFRAEYTKAFPKNESNERTINFEYLYIDRIALMCSNGPESCISKGFGEPVFYDQHHLSLGYSKLIGKKMEKKYKTQLKGIGL